MLLCIRARALACTDTEIGALVKQVRWRVCPAWSPGAPGRSQLSLNALSQLCYASAIGSEKGERRIGLLPTASVVCDYVDCAIVAGARKLWVGLQGNERRHPSFASAEREGGVGCVGFRWK
jgi:hypothetical protein